MPRTGSAVAAATMLLVLATPASGAEPVEFRFENKQKATEMKAVIHGLAGWVYIPWNDSRSINHTFGVEVQKQRSEYYYDVTVTQNREGSPVYCSWHIEVTQTRNYDRSETSHCTIKSGYPSSTQICTSGVHHEPYNGACEFTFTVSDPG